MRTFVVEKGTHSLKSLSTLLLGNKAGSASALDQLKNLNPHVDFKKIEPGTVLLIPDVPGLRGAAGASVTGDAFDELREQVLASVRAAGARVSSGYDARLNEQKEVAAVLKSGGLERALKADPELKPQIFAATQVFKQDQQQAKAADETLKALQQQATAELAQLAKTLGGS
jgi:hypothetical protein